MLPPAVPRVRLAGFNLDAEVIARGRALGLDPDTLTPETISAAYARISRDPAPVHELRHAALSDVARARASNQRIVFGLGHASVAEHAVFNFDVLGISRLAIEALEAFRLCSYTEKSQRYTRLEGDVVLPEEVVAAGLAEPFAALLRQQQQAYQRIYAGVLAHLSAEQPELATRRSGRRKLEGVAKEDARYATALAVTGQLGLTANARNLEHAVRRLAGHPLAEVRALAEALRAPAEEVAPSLIRYPEPTAAQRRTPAELAALCAELLPPSPPSPPAEPGPDPDTTLLWATPEGDLRVGAALLQEASVRPHGELLQALSRLSPGALLRVFVTALRRLGPHEPLPRALELATLRFEVVVSAACFGQLKRHRMATLLPGPYAPELGVTVPPSVKRAGLGDALLEAAEAGAALHRELVESFPAAAAYPLTQAHRRRVLLQLNARELGHFCRLRLDGHAQWEIRALAGRLLELARAELPLCTLLCAGKDRFAETRAAALGPDAPEV